MFKKIYSLFFAVAFAITPTALFSAEKTQHDTRRVIKMLKMFTLNEHDTKIHGSAVKNATEIMAEWKNTEQFKNNQWKQVAWTVINVNGSPQLFSFDPHHAYHWELGIYKQRNYWTPNGVVFLPQSQVTENGTPTTGVITRCSFNDVSAHMYNDPSRLNGLEIAVKLAQKNMREDGLTHITLTRGYWETDAFWKEVANIGSLIPQRVAELHDDTNFVEVTDVKEL